MIRPKLIGIAALTFTSCLFSVTAVFHSLGFRLNTTASAPVGLWRVQEAVTYQKGDFVEVCPPDLSIIRVMVDKGYLATGNCPTNVITLLKPIAVGKGDIVTIRKGLPVSINGMFLPNTRSMPTIQAWPDGTYLTKENEIWLFSTYSSGSFDSRYFGPVDISNIRGKAVPVLVIGDPAEMLLTREQA